MRVFAQHKKIISVCIKLIFKSQILKYNLNGRKLNVHSKCYYFVKCSFIIIIFAWMCIAIIFYMRKLIIKLNVTL